MKEIERKFLVKKLPANLEAYPHKEVEQVYILLDPEIRARRVDDEFFFTIKTGSGMTRGEHEMTISDIAFDSLKANAVGSVIHKTRYYIELDCGLLVEVDKFHGDLAPLYLAEIEFPSEQEANLFLPLSWFGEEVTYDTAYKNQSLAVKGLKNNG